ncbi:helix-turn-helix domain-containing protein [Conexibacter woesei]|uniref:Transcriptional regulator, TetR family n=1 Tax=Conexibacter woesei (strain DSM 14684 / CCUG 47730 / CIP 108061 / JCM 11494 / NBRC 100937 / ID131577) TaxID=469383 RepID=D3F8P5_CONWI|nr:hypothetical protein [Conexibacter woesei]ADB51009.1 hypothetical protein Cwoe_2590 [Conexibacter woesei DSM 14684]
MPAPLAPPPRRRPGRPAAVDATAILDAAEAIGLPSLSVAAVAARLDVSESTVRYHVGSAARLHTRTSAQIFDRLDLVAPAAERWPDYLRELCERLVALRRAAPGLEQYLLEGPYEERTLDGFDRIIDELVARAPGMTRETGYMLGASAVIAVSTDPAVAFDEARADPDMRERVAILSRWKRDALIEGMERRVERGDVPQLPPTSAAARERQHQRR